MGLYTTFHFRAKLRFDLPAAVVATIQGQCTPWPAERALPGPWTSGDDAGLTGTAPQATPDGFNWAGWHQHPHLFFTLPRADAIPRGRDYDNWPEADFRRYADGGGQLVFTCALKNINQEIEQFLDWIAPYVRFRFGKRTRGRRRVWVGWYRMEGERLVNIYLERCFEVDEPPVRAVIDFTQA